jgi:predicted Zn-dependent protease
MAHEISHVALRHGTNQVTKAMGFQILLGVVGGAVGDDSLWRQLVQAGAGFGANSVLLKYSRDAERQADLLGAHIISGAGYDPVAMARFFDKLQAEGGSRGPEFFSSHPNPGNRTRLVQDALRGMPRRTYSQDDTEFLRFRDRVRALGNPPAKPKPPERSRTR